MTALGRLIGKWELSGDVSGTIEYERAEGGHFLVQHVDMVYSDRAIRGIEFIGHVAKPGQPASAEIHSRFYSFLDGLTLDYLYEMETDMLRIWFEDKSLNNFMQAEFSPDGSNFSGAWRWPGGGYRFHARKIGD